MTWISILLDRNVCWNKTHIWTNHATTSKAHHHHIYLSLSTLLKPGIMCLKLELRSSLGWLLVRLMEPFSRRLRKPWGTERDVVNKHLFPLGLRELSITALALVGNRTGHINTDVYTALTKCTKGQTSKGIEWYKVSIDFHIRVRLIFTLDGESHNKVTHNMNTKHHHEHSQPGEEIRAYGRMSLTEMTMVPVVFTDCVNQRVCVL